MLAVAAIFIVSMTVLAKANSEVDGTASQPRSVALPAALTTVGICVAAAAGVGIGLAVAKPYLTQRYYMNKIDFDKENLQDAAPRFKSVTPGTKGDFYAPNQFASPTTTLYPDFETFKSAWDREKTARKADDKFATSPMHAIYEKAATSKTLYNQLLAVVYSKLIEAAKEAKLDVKATDDQLTAVLTKALAAVPKVYNGKDTVTTKDMVHHLRCVRQSIAEPDQAVALPKSEENKTAEAAAASAEDAQEQVSPKGDDAPKEPAKSE